MIALVVMPVKAIRSTEGLGEYEYELTCSLDVLAVVLGFGLVVRNTWRHKCVLTHLIRVCCCCYLAY